MESLFKNPKLKWPAEMVSYGAQTLARESLDTLFEAFPQDTLSADLPF